MAEPVGNLRFAQSDAQVLHDPNPEVLVVRPPEFESYMHRYYRRLTRPTVNDAWAWVGLLFATLPAYLSDEFTIDFVMGKEEWKPIFGALSVISFIAIARIAFSLFVEAMRETHIPCTKRTWLPRPLAWVPKDPVDFTESVCEWYRQKILANQNHDGDETSSAYGNDSADTS